MFYPLVSVIIPVYQAEKFLTECVESVRKQDYSELEIVLVNDGSTDRSNQMCDMPYLFVKSSVALNLS